MSLLIETIFNGWNKIMIVFWTIVPKSKTTFKAVCLYLYSRPEKLNVIFMCVLLFLFLYVLPYPLVSRVGATRCMGGKGWITVVMFLVLMQKNSLIHDQHQLMIPVRPIGPMVQCFSYSPTAFIFIKKEANKYCAIVHLILQSCFPPMKIKSQQWQSSW